MRARRRWPARRKKRARRALPGLGPPRPLELALITGPSVSVQRIRPADRAVATLPPPTNGDCRSPLEPLKVVMKMSAKLAPRRADVAELQTRIGRRHLRGRRRPARIQHVGGVHRRRRQPVHTESVRTWVRPRQCARAQKHYHPGKNECTPRHGLAECPLDVSMSLCPLQPRSFAPANRPRPPARQIPQLRPPGVTQSTRQDAGIRNSEDRRYPHAHRRPSTATRPAPPRCQHVSPLLLQFRLLGPPVVQDRMLRLQHTMISTRVETSSRKTRKMAENIGPTGPTHAFLRRIPEGRPRVRP